MKRSLFRLSLCLSCFMLFAACGNKKEQTTVAFTDDADPAVRSVSQRIAAQPNNARLYYERGMIWSQRGKDTLALEDFKKSVSLDSTKAEYFSAIGNLMFEHKDVEGSIPFIEKAITLNPDDPKARLKIAKMFVFLQEYPKAFTEINTVLRKNAMVPEAYFLKGLIYKELKDTAKSISSFQTALQVDPSYREAMIQLGSIFSTARNPLALKYYDNAFRSDSDDVFPLYAKGMYFQEQEKYEEAKEEYRNAILHDRNYADAYFAIGFILLQQDSLEKARRQFDLVTKIEPTNEKAYYNRGLAAEMMGRNTEALQDYQQALTFAPDYKQAEDGVRRLKK